MLVLKRLLHVLHSFPIVNVYIAVIESDILQMCSVSSLYFQNATQKIPEQSLLFSLLLLLLFRLYKFMVRTSIRSNYLANYHRLSRHCKDFRILTTLLLLQSSPFLSYCFLDSLLRQSISSLQRPDVLLCTLFRRSILVSSFLR